ncbi:hypothetical protein [Streptacidiphilus sp. EB103A]|uniref:hypothetical protein n=1 Tax=Streptacidiphilus sp. EB103A TaxID=3156275 RepID=UPI0035198161
MPNRAQWRLVSLVASVCGRSATAAASARRARSMVGRVLEARGSRSAPAAGSGAACAVGGGPARMPLAGGV